MAKLDRIRWHCRRGMLELDLVLDRFNRAHLAELEGGELLAFEELLALPDNDLLDLIMERAQSNEPRYDAILRLLRA